MIIPRPLGQWTPDVPDLANGGLIQAKGCYPSAGGYAPFWSGETTSLTISGTINGAKRFERTTGDEVHVIGTTTDLYVMVNGVVTASSLALASINPQENWSFEQFGSAIYATIKSHTADGRQSFYLTDIDTDTSFSASPGTPPAGNALARIDDFLVYGDLKDIDDSNTPFRIRWSAFNNPQLTYTTDIATQQGYYDMPSYLGKVRGIVGGTVGYIMQSNGTSALDYTGGAAAFQRVLLEGSEDQSAGCVGQASIASVGNVHYWLSDVGFCRLSGGAISLISKGRVWDWFLENANTEYLHKVQAVVNADRRCVIWNFYGVDLTTYTNQIIYNWEQDAWTNNVLSVDWLVPVTYDGAFGEGDPRMRQIIGGFVSGEFFEYSGTALAAVLETGEFEINPGQRSFVRGVRPMVENVSANTKIAIKYRDFPGVAKTGTASTAEGTLGYTPVSVDARYFAVEMTIPAAAVWDKANAVQIDAEQSGSL